MSRIEPQPHARSLGITGGPSDDQSCRFERLVWPHLKTLLRTARYLTRNDDAEDLVQETMIKAMKALDHFQDGTNMQAWLMMIMRRTHIDRWRSAKRRREDVALDCIDETQIKAQPVGCFDDQWEDPKQMLDRFEDQVVIDALKSLPQPICWTLVLVDVEQLDHAQAAAILEVPVGTIKSRVHRGRQMLRDHLYPIAQTRGWIPVAQGQVS